MKVYKRICLKNYELKASNGTLSLKKGKTYLTSRARNNILCVFTNFWVNVPANIFGKPKALK